MRHRGSADAVTESPRFCGAVIIYTRDLKTDPEQFTFPQESHAGERGS